MQASRNETIRVANITEEGRYGGPHKRIMEVAAGLKERGFETTVVFPEQDSQPYQEKLRESQVPFQTLSLHRISKSVTELFWYLVLFPWEVLSLCRTLKKLKTQIVHCNGSYQVKGMLAAKLAGCRGVWHMNDTFMPSYLRVFFRAVSLIASDKFIAASHRTANYYFPNPKTNIPIVPAPIETQNFSVGQVTADPKVKQLSGIKIVTVANLNPVKGYRTLLPAVQILRSKTDIDFQVIAVGKFLDNQKSYIAELEAFKAKHALDNFHFWGVSNHVKEILAACDVYVCASDFESSPISVWEAMSMSLPIVATDVGDVRKIIEDSDCGVVCNSQDPEALAAALLETISLEDTERKKMGKQARNNAEKLFDAKICLDNHERIYRELVS